MQGIRFENLEDDTTILSIGSLFRRLDGSQWGVNLELWPYQKKKSLTVSQLPVLVRNRVLNPTTDNGIAGYEQYVSIENSDEWKVCNVGDCPVLQGKRLSDREASQQCFYFRSNEGLNVYLPQFELARALFFHDAYLARTALEADALKIEFDIVPDEVEDAATINVLQSSSYTRKSLDNNAARRVLSWILIDPEARSSYESIGQYQKMHGIEVNGYRHWNFKFNPPKLPGVEFVFRGRFDRDSKSIFVYEITSVRNIVHWVPAKVEFYSPKFKEPVRGEGSGGHRPTDERPDEHSVEDGEDANSNTEHVQLQAPVVTFEFAKPFATSKIYKKKQKNASGRKDDEEGKEASKNVSTEEGDETGGKPQADWDITDDNSDDAHLYANKFSCFQDMLAILETVHKCKVISKQIRKLPKIGRCERHILKTDGSPRCMAVIAINCNGKVFHILEADTSDAAKPLSTKLLLVNEPVRWHQQIVELERQFLKASLCWPTKYLEHICGVKRHKSIPHPKTESANKGELELGSIERWAKRFHSWMHT